MPSYRVVFKNGEKEKFVCTCATIRVENHVMTFYDDARQIVALIPEDNVLYIKQVS